MDCCEIKILVQDTAGRVEMVNSFIFLCALLQLSGASQYQTEVFLIIKPIFQMMVVELTFLTIRDL